MAPYRLRSIYFGYDLPSIIRYKVLQDEICKAYFQNFKFIETKSRGAQITHSYLKLNIKALETLILNSDPRVALVDLEVRKPIKL